MTEYRHSPHCSGLRRPKPVRRCLHGHHPSRPRRPVTGRPAPPLRHIDVTVIEIAAHTAYLEPATGTGFLVLPHSEAAADWECVSDELHQLGWFPLDDETGQPEIAGTTADGRIAICLFGENVATEPSTADFYHALTALRCAAGVGPE